MLKFLYNMKFPFNVVHHLLTDAYMAGLTGEPIPSYDEPHEPYYIIVGNMISAAYKNGSNRFPFDVFEAAIWLDELQYEIQNNDYLPIMIHPRTFEYFMVKWDDGIKLESTNMRIYHGRAAN